MWPTTLIAAQGTLAKAPGDAFGASLAFEHKGTAEAVWVGIGLAYGELIGHNPPFCYAMKEVTVGDDPEWKSYAADVEGTVPQDVAPGKLLDAQRFISDSMPAVGQQPPNPFGVNNWDDEVYSTPGALGLLDMIMAMMPLMIMVMMIGMIMPMISEEP